MAKNKRHVTLGLLPACTLRASPINKINLLCGSAGKVFKLDGRQQAVNVGSNSKQLMNKVFLILALYLVPTVGTSQSKYTIDIYVGFLRYFDDSIQFDSPKLITTTTNGLTSIVSLGRTKNYEFGIKIEILKSKFYDTSNYIVGKAYYVKKDDKWEEILKFCHSPEIFGSLKERSKFIEPKYVWGGGSTLEPITYEVRQNDYYYVSY